MDQSEIVKMLASTLAEAQQQFASALALIEDVRNDLASLECLPDPLPHSKSQNVHSE